MRLRFPFGSGFQTVEIDDSISTRVIEPMEAEREPTDGVILDALKNPINVPTLEEFINESGHLLIIVNDATRPTPTVKILDFLASQIEKSDIEFIVATGTHRSPSESEMFKIFGANFEKWKGRITVHDSRDVDSLDHIGRTSFGTEVYLNRRFLESKTVLIIGSVEPHYFAGYTGGRKAIVPGLAAYETVEQNHKNALSQDSQGLRLKRNPVSDDIDEAIDLIQGKNILSLQVVLDRNSHVCAAYFGDLRNSFLRAVEKADEIYSPGIEDRADIVLTVVSPPMDIDFYQAHKAIENARHVVNDRGILIFASACHNGLGPSNFYRILREMDDTDSLKRKVDAEYKLGYHKAVKLAEFMERCNLWGVTQLDSDVLEAVSIRHFDSIQNALDMAIEMSEPDAKLLVIRDGTLMFPRLN